MSNIHVSFDGRIMTISSDGICSADDMVQSINEYYPSSGDRFILWDLMRADLSSLTEEGFGRIALAARKTLPPREGRKTAIAVANRSGYLIMSKYINEAVSARLPAEYSVFTNFDAAKQWLEKR
ncbi:MAG TPA: hypothetical protein VGP21_05315 [Opitutaceae bacterium]|jgi:hypothetical protein|nr:hypothetical protein [Opitutaceae bacterium]